MKPTEVNDSMFPVHRVLYDADGFSVIWGNWNKEGECLGMRWNGDEGSAYPNGYPVGKGGRPIWLVIPKQLSVSFVSSLLGSSPAAKDAVIQTLSGLLNPTTAK